MDPLNFSKGPNCASPRSVGIVDAEFKFGDDFRPAFKLDPPSKLERGREAPGRDINLSLKFTAQPEPLLRVIYR